jgi:polysaccharide biosynthesis transport protein
MKSFMKSDWRDYRFFRTVRSWQEYFFNWKGRDWQDCLFCRRVRIGLPALIFIVATFCDLHYIYSRPVVFESSAKIWIKTKAATTIGDAQGASPFFNSPIATAAEVMKSSVVLNEAMKSLKLALPSGKIPELENLRGGVKVTPIQDTDVLEISFQHANPAVACEVVKAVVNGFIGVSNTQASMAAVQSRAFLEKQVAAARRQHEAARQALRDFQVRTNRLDVSQEAGALLSQINTVKGQLRDAHVELATVQSRINSLTQQLGMSAESAAAIDKISQDPVVQELRRKLSAYSVKLAEARERFSDDSARATRIKRSIQQTEAEINQRIKALYGNLPVTADKLPMGANDKRQTILEQLEAARHDESAVKNKIVQLQSSLAGLSGSVGSLPSAQSTFADLTRTEKVAADTLSNQEHDLSTAQLTESTSQDSSNTQIIEQPEIAKRPESANGKKIFAMIESVLALFCGGLFYLLMYFDPHLYSVAKFSKLIPFPVAGGVGDEVFSRTASSLPVLHRVRLAIQDWVGSEPIAVIGSGRGDGTTSVACGVAFSYHQAGKRVLLIDANFANPAIHTLFNLPDSPGLSDFAATRDLLVLESAVREVAPQLMVIATGSENPSCILEGTALDNLLTFAKSRADVVIFDTTAASAFHSGIALLSRIKKALVVIRLAHTRIVPLKDLANWIAGKEVDAIVVATNASESDVVKAEMQTETEHQSEATQAAW